MTEEQTTEEQTLTLCVCGQEVYARGMCVDCASCQEMQDTYYEQRVNVQSE